MDAETKFRSIQLRAYEIYRERNPDSGTPEDDWRKAESQIGQEEDRGSRDLEPARLRKTSHSTLRGGDPENLR